MPLPRDRHITTWQEPILTATHACSAMHLGEQMARTHYYNQRYHMVTIQMLCFLSDPPRREFRNTDVMLGTQFNVEPYSLRATSQKLAQSLPFYPTGSPKFSDFQIVECTMIAGQIVCRIHTNASSSFATCPPLLDISPCCVAIEYTSLGLSILPIHFQRKST